MKGNATLGRGGLGSCEQSMVQRTSDELAVVFGDVRGRDLRSTAG